MLKVLMDLGLGRLFRKGQHGASPWKVNKENYLKLFITVVPYDDMSRICIG